MALQSKFHVLETTDVLVKPEQVNIHVKYMNTSFFEKKLNGGSRLVTSSDEVAQYSFPQPSLIPNVYGALRDMRKGEYMVIMNLLKSFYQNLLVTSSMIYCGVVTPFRASCLHLFCYGDAGSETCLEELMSRTLGDLI